MLTFTMKFTYGRGMTIIGATYLRHHLDRIFDRVLAGEEFIIQHRTKGPIKLSPMSEQHDDSRPTGLAALDRAPRKKYIFPPDQDWKSLYSASLDSKYLNG